MCVDQDKDGRGFQCEAGEDCDDTDPTVFEGCAACSRPSDGCVCESDAAPVDCTLSKQVNLEGTLLCKTGTRYCRDGKWSACEGIKTFEAPPPSRLLTQALIDPDAGPITCSACSPDCYQTEDPLEPDASYGDGSIVAGPTGGITLSSYQIGGGDGGSGSAADAGLLDDYVCTPDAGPDPDCDGLIGPLDPFPGSPPFASDHNTIFMDLGPGDAQEETFEIRFYLNTADIYLYLDMTGSMDGERVNLIDSLRDGNFMPADRVGEECADRDFDGDTADEEHLKDEGIAGNLACLIRDSRLGTGWHRDLPFPKADAAGFAYGPHDFEVFQHEQDITGDVTAVLASLNRFVTRGGINRPEGGLFGLHSIATGTGLYTGWNRPGNADRAGCPAGTWGYPCFRDDAVPIVIWMTDAPVANGPVPTQGHMGPAQNNTTGAVTNQPVNYGASAMAIETGSDGRYNAVGTANETFGTALDVGGINDTFRTYTADTSSMRADVTYTNAGLCGVGNAWLSTAQGAPDAVFKMTVTEAEPITVSTRGSRYQTTLAIIDADRINGTTATVAASGNALPTAPQTLGALTFPTVVNVSGTTSGASAQFTRDALGCLASNTGSSDMVGASVLHFTLANDVPSLRVVSDGNYALSSTLFAAQPKVPTSVNLATAVWTTGSGTRTGNANDYFGSYNIGNLTGAYRRYTNGCIGSCSGVDTSDDLTPQIAASVFQGGSCSGASGAAKDAVFDFSVSTTTRLRIEGSGNNATLQAGFDHAIALVERNTVLQSTTAGNFTDATASSILLANVPAQPFSWAQYSGTLGGVTSTYLQSEIGPFVAATSATDCTNAAALTTGYQGVYTIDTTGLPDASYDFDTAGSAISTYLSFHEDLADTQRPVPVTTQPNATHTVLTNAMNLGALDEVSLLVTGGSLATHSTSTAADFVATGPLGCGGASVIGGRDAVYRFTVTAPQTISVRVGSSATTATAFAPGSPGFNSYVAVFQNSLTAGNRIAGDCTDQGGTGTTESEVTNVNVVPGNTYYVLVKSVATGALSGTGAAYGLWIRDTTFSSHFRGCDYGSQLHASSSIRAAKLTRTLQANRRYYVVVRGTTASGYQLNVRRTPTAEPTARACDRNRSGAQHSVIDEVLTPGNYSVIVRGYSAADQGLYNLIFRDMGVAPDLVACQYDANTTNPAVPLTVSNLPARDVNNALINYYLVMRGNTGTGAYTVRLEDGSFNPTQCAFDNVSMTYPVASPVYQWNGASRGADQSITDINNAEWTGTLPVGDYYVVLKGYNTSDSVSNTEDNDWGMYQLTVGDQTHFEGAGTFDAKRWLGPAGDGVGGVRNALLDRKIRVITVDSTWDADDGTYSDQQLRTIAQATNAVALDGSPLFFKINDNGTGLGTAIVDAVNTLAGNLAMDVSVRFVESPDSPSPRHFRFRAEAIDQVGDLCEPPVSNDGDPDNIPDTHVRCRPGAVPRFKISIANPAPPNNVPSNPTDPLGGYNMRIDLIGDGTYVVDQIPIYIIPEDVVDEPGENRFEPIGTYEQTISAQGCFGTEAPLWKDLRWSADIPSGTTLTWKVCTANTLAELSSCTLQTAATVQTGGGCLDDSNCVGGYCNEAKLCEYAAGPSCSEDAACGSNGACVTPCANGVCEPSRCQWTHNPIDVKPALLRSLQGKRHARVQVLLQSNTAHTRAPTVHSWGLNYTCTALE